MRLFKRNKEVKERKSEDYVKELLVTGKVDNKPVSRKEVEGIPSINAGVDLITSIAASLEFKLYKENNGTVEEVKDDKRVRLLNDYSEDVLTGFDMKKAVFIDYLYDGNGYIYINKKRNEVISLHYVDSKEVSITESNDPIFKDNIINVRGEEYRHYDFISMCRNTKNGSDGTGIVQEFNLLLTTMYSAQQFEGLQMKTGGVKKGVIKSAKKLTKEAIEALKNSWRKLYKNDTEENCIILNDGLDYKELQQTAVEMQVLEHKKENGIEALKILKLPSSTFNNPSQAVTDHIINIAVEPILVCFESAINKSLLLEKEKDNYFFSADRKNLNKGDIEKRYKAYELGLKNGFLLPNEVRYQEDLAQIENFDFLRMSLGEILYNIKTGELFTPNTGQSKPLKEGDTSNEDRNKE